jgi:nucleotide-binding universal stress UspA family protein
MKILVPTDFSEYSENAKNIAFDIAKRTNGEVTFLHSVNVPSVFYEMEAYVPANIPKSADERKKKYPELAAVVGRAEANLNNWVNEGLLQNITTHGVLAYNLASDDIIEHVAKFNSDMIVMGSHGANAIEEITIGSTTQKVMKVVKCPVLAVKKTCPSLNFKNIVFASDFEEEIVKEKFEKLYHFARLYKAKIHLLFVNTPANFEDSRYSKIKMDDIILKHFNDNNITANIYNDYSVEEGILSFAKDTEADLISLYTHGYTGLRKLLSDNISERVVNYSELPVLVFNKNA